MQLTDEHIQQFQKLWEKRFHKKISKKEALEKGLKLVHFMELVYRSMRNEQQPNRKNHRSTTGEI